MSLDEESVEDLLENLRDKKAQLLGEIHWIDECIRVVEANKKR